MAPRGDLASTGYCLANPGKEYLVYIPEGGEVTVENDEFTGALPGRLVRGPQHRNAVATAVQPVVAEVVEQQREDPDPE